MQPETYSSGEIVERGKHLYEQQIKAAVEPQHPGEFLGLDVDTGHFTLGDDSRTALQSARAQWPHASLFLIHVDFPTAVKLGADSR